MNFLQISHNSFQYWQVVRLRDIELRMPLGLRLSYTDILQDANNLIYGLEDQNKIIACSLVDLQPNRAKLRQVATEKKYQGKGIGRSLYLQIEQNLITKSVESIYCHARIEAVPFYEKLGFEPLGNEFLELEIKHLMMIKKNLK